jgi:hypothetical protein
VLHLIGGLHNDLRVLLSDLDAAGIKTKREIQHMKYLQHFQQGRAGPVSNVDIQKIMLDAGSDPLLELPGAPPDEGSCSDDAD